jgi:hypothetical protein
MDGSEGCREDDNADIGERMEDEEGEEMEYA